MRIRRQVTWDWLLRIALGLPNVEPNWIDLPAMMQIRLSTPHMLKRVNKGSRPYSFFLSPLIDSIAGYPASIDRNKFTLLAPFTRNRNTWMNSEFINIHDGQRYSLALAQTPNFDKVIPQTFGYILRLYPLHPESKSVAPDGSECDSNTIGLLQRMHVIAAMPRFIGKESDRKWDHGEDLSLLKFSPARFDGSDRVGKADPVLIERLATILIKALAREAQIDRNTIRKVLRGGSVRCGILQRLSDAFSCIQPSVSKSIAIRRC